MLSEAKKRKRTLEQLNRLEPLEIDPFPRRHGVLYSNVIRYLCERVPHESRMIDPFDQSKMHPAGYKLSVGDEYYLGGNIYYLPSYETAPSEFVSKRLEIPPFQVAVLKTREVLCLPRFVIARWNIVVKKAYDGLLWVGGPHVDPGYVGHLYCPIYNLSDKSVILHEGDDIALMDFVKTTRFPHRFHRTKEKWIRWRFDENKVILDDYVRDGLKSALFTKAAARLDEVESRAKTVEDRLDRSTQFTLAALAVIPAILVGLLPFREAAMVSSIWGPLAVGFSTFAVCSSLLHWMGRRTCSGAAAGASPAETPWRSRSLALTVTVGTALVALVSYAYVTHRYFSSLVMELARDGSATASAVSDQVDMEASILELTGEIARTDQRVEEVMRRLESVYGLPRTPDVQGATRDSLSSPKPNTVPSTDESGTQP